VKKKTSIYFFILRRLRVALHAQAYRIITSTTLEYRTREIARELVDHRQYLCVSEGLAEMTFDSLQQFAHTCTSLGCPAAAAAGSAGSACGTCWSILAK
jgi:hypothetical protein